MKNKNPIFKFAFKVTAIIIISIVISLFLTNFLVYQFTKKALIQELRNSLMIFSQSVVLSIDSEMLKSVPLKKDSINLNEYKIIQNKFKEFKKIYPRIEAIYTFSKTEKKGQLQFIVDMIPILDDKAAPTSLPGDTYDATRFHQMLKAFEGISTADKKFIEDAWGVSLSGYAPIRDKNGEVFAILGVDINVKDVHDIINKAKSRIFFVTAIGFVIAIIMGNLFSRTITAPIGQLVVAIRKVSDDDLRHRVDIKRNDEIGELAISFNKMARNLYRSRIKLLRYFQYTVLSLIRILEAKDEYTKGHSQSVADYAYKIAVKMGIEKDKLKVFQNMTVLHDIGKVGLNNAILNKPDKLTDEEWEIVKQHPVIGEQILKPIINSEEMLSIVKNHHERYDGKGYPDKIAGDDISIYASIVAVADAYHAMTSDRAYRKALSKQEAIKELEKCKGTQFNPKVIDVFLELLSKEDFA